MIYDIEQTDNTILYKKLLKCNDNLNFAVILSNSLEMLENSLDL
jgi:hypothetical protein